MKEKKMNSKKITALILTMALASMTLAACGSGGTESQSSETQSSTTASVETTETTSEVTDISDASDPGDGGIDSDYVDQWYLYGNLDYESLTINEDSTWELSTPPDDVNSDGIVSNEGYSVMSEHDTLLLYVTGGAEVGYVSISDNQLTLVLTEDYEYMFEDYYSYEMYSEDGLLFSHAADSEYWSDAGDEDDTEDRNYSGDGEIGNGYVDMWHLNGDSFLESIEIDTEGTWEMRNLLNDDGTGGYIMMDGSAIMLDDGSLVFYDSEGNEVGSATLSHDELTIVLTEDYEYLLESYSSDSYLFIRG